MKIENYQYTIIELFDIPKPSIRIIHQLDYYLDKEKLKKMPRITINVIVKNFVNLIGCNNINIFSN